MRLGLAVLYFSVFAAVLLVLEFILRKWHKIEKVKLSDTKAKKIDRWGRGIVLVVTLGVFPFFLSGSFQQMIGFWIVYMSVVSVFEAFLQWKYARESKESILTLIFFPLGAGSMLLFAFWMSGSL